MSSPSRRKCFQLPVASTEIPHVRLEFPGDHLDLRFQYRAEGAVRHAGLRFESVRAHRHRAELYCTADEIDAAYDTQVEIEDSAWIRELVLAAPEDQRHSWKMTHYMIYFDSNGCYEVVAAGWRELTGETALDVS